jgi:predicted nucleotidyltransferase
MPSRPNVWTEPRRRVILFGYTARGKAGPDSDIDLLVVVDDDTPGDNPGGTRVSKELLRAG